MSRSRFFATVVLIVGLVVSFYKIYGELFVYSGFANGYWDWFDLAMSGILIIFTLWLASLIFRIGKGKRLMSELAERRANA